MGQIAKGVLLSSMNPTQSIKVRKRPSSERGLTDMGWLHSQHSFSFGSYMDPDHVGYRSLKVINEDQVEAGQGFGMHPHKSMEILSYVVDGELEHKDSMGNGRTIRTGEFQYMSAGSGVLHSEYNPSSDKPVHFLQIWILPRKQGGEPRYKDFDTTSKRVENGLYLLASPSGKEGSAAIRQDAEIYFGDISGGISIDIPMTRDYPYIWIQVIKGKLDLAGMDLKAGDGAAIEDGGFVLTGIEDSEFLLFCLK